MSDFQFRLQMDYDSQHNVWDQMPQPAMKRQIWFTRLCMDVHNELPDFIDKPIEYITDVLALAMKRLMPYNMQAHVPVEFFGKIFKPSDSPHLMQYILVSLKACDAFSSSM